MLLQCIPKFKVQCLFMTCELAVDLLIICDYMQPKLPLFLYFCQLFMSGKMSFQVDGHDFGVLWFYGQVVEIGYSLKGHDTVWSCVGHKSRPDLFLYVFQMIQNHIFYNYEMVTATAIVSVQVSSLLIAKEYIKVTLCILCQLNLQSK